MLKQFFILTSFLWMSFFIYSCSSENNEKKSKQRWASGDYKKVKDLKLDVDSVQKAFNSAKSPLEFEKQVNEIYTGNEIISINVRDQGNKNQIVSLYIDNNTENGKMDQDETILTLNRVVDEANNQVQVSTTGYGPYAYYSSGPSPLVYALTGSLITYWAMSRPFYSTPIDRFSDIREQRSSYRKTQDYQNQKVKTRNFSNNFNKSASSDFKRAPKKFSQSSSFSSPASAKKKKSGSWFSGFKRARSNSSMRRSFRSFGGRRRR